MSPNLPYYYTLHLEEGVLGRAWLNDLPLHKVPTHGPESTTGGANHMLVPGKNTLALEILRLPPPRVKPAPPEPGKPASPEVDMSPAGIKIYQVLEPNVEPITATLVVDVEIPAALGLTQYEAVTVPFYHEVEFELPVAVPEPVYWRAPVATFGCSGTPELQAAVTELHDAVKRGDVKRFLELITLRHEIFAAAFPGEPAASVERQRAAVERFFALKIAVKPLDLTKVHFEPRAGGRVAMASGWDDRPVLEAIAEEHPGLALRANILFTQIDGNWRIFG
jgi:hypothetical protein